MSKSAFATAMFALLSSMIVAWGNNNVRIYINPGHGSWGPNDRPYPTIPYPNLSSTGRPDTCGFYESNTNLWKCVEMRDALIRMGVDGDNISLSRWNNGPYPYVSGASDATAYNRNLTEIAREVEVGGYDMFISVHSNAEGAAGTENNINYPLFLYRGRNGNGNEAVAGSYEMGEALWGPHWEDQVDWISTTTYSRTKPLLRGDVDFYGSGSNTTNNGTTYYGYLGVLKHGVPGVLIEGFYHSYGPTRHRALNEDFCRQEGVRLARGVADYFNLTPEPTGYIMGTVKDQSQSLAHDQYKHKSGTKDDYYPINGAMVTLYKGDDFISSYHTDDNYNGVFAFKNLAPGDDYYISVKANGYANINKNGPYSVTANETTYPLLYVASGTAESLGTSDLTLSLTKEYTDQAIQELAGKTVRRILHKDGQLIVLAVENDTQHTPHIYLVDPDTHTVTGTVSTQGLSDVTNGSRRYKLSDIALTDDGMLIGCNQEETVYNTTAGTFRVYKWNNLNAQPVQWFTSPADELKSGRWYNADVGNSFAFNGTSQHGNMLTAAVTTGSSRQIRYVTYVVRDGALDATRTKANYDKDVSANRGNLSATAYGEDFMLLPSPLREDQFIIDGSLITPIELRLNTLDSKAHKEFGHLPTDDMLSTGGSIVALGGRKLYVTPLAAGGNNQGIALHDITSGVASAEQVITTNGNLASLQASVAMTTGDYSGDNLTLFLVRDNMLSKWSATVETHHEPIVVGDEIGIFAYDLNSVMNDAASYTFTFKSNNDATEAYIVFSDSDTGNEVGRIEIPEVQKGQNSITVDHEDLPGNDNQVMNWAVEVHGRDITAVRRLNGSKNDSQYAYAHATVAVDRSPESDYFGSIYVGNLVGFGNASNGIYRYDPLWSRENNTPYKGGQTFRRNERMAVDSEGRLYVPDFGDTHSGLYIARPEELSSSNAFTQFFAGTRASSGLITLNGVNTGSSVSGVSLSGSGANTKLYAACEDMNQQVYMYDLGSQVSSDDALPWSWSTAPAAVHEKTQLRYSNMNVWSMEDGGLWVSENLYTSDGNLSNTISSSSTADNHPALRYINPDRSDYWTYATNSNLAIDLNGCAGGGFAISNDNSTLVIADKDGILNFYAINWQTDNTGQPKPVLTKKFTYDADAKDSGATSVSSGRVPNGVYQMAFDWGGNLLVAGGNLGVYSIPTTNNTSTTPAKRTLTVTKWVTKSLAQVVESGVGNYIVTEGLTCIYVNDDGTKMWAKDDNQFASPDVNSNNLTDYAQRSGFQTYEYDQSNWVEILLPEPIDGLEYIGYTLGPVMGRLTSSLNPTIEAQSTPVAKSLANAYDLNKYVGTNFISDHTDSNGNDYFFVTPKPQEIASLEWCLWDGEHFIVPPSGSGANGNANSLGFKGGFNVSLDMLGDYSSQQPSDIFQENYIYEMSAVIKRIETPSGSPAKRATTVVSDQFMVYPIRISMSQSIITGVEQQSVSREIVSSDIYDLNGRKQQELCKGVNIVVSTYSDGTTQTKKIIR